MVEWLRISEPGAPRAQRQLSALAWSGAFMLYLWRFLPLMIRPRSAA